MRTTVTVAGVVLALTFVLSACGGDDPVAAPPESVVPLAADADGASVYPVSYTHLTLPTKA